MKRKGSQLAHFVAVLMALPFLAFGQTSSEQLWIEYMPNYSFANSWNLENIFMYSTLLDKPRWRSLEYYPTLEYSVTPHIDVSLGCALTYTIQDDDYNTFEVRPVLGTKVHLTPNKRILSRIYMRIEQRNIEDLDTKDWKNVWRPRIRGELLIPINRKSFHDDKLWYGLLDAEWFFTLEEDVDERFANRFRLRMGLGYRLSYTSRFEFIYMIQESKNTIEGSFYTADNIFRFRYRHYLRKHKPSKLSGTGN